MYFKENHLLKQSFDQEVNPMFGSKNKNLNPAFIHDSSYKHTVQNVKRWLIQNLQNKLNKSYPGPTPLPISTE